MYVLLSLSLSPFFVLSLLSSFSLSLTHSLLLSLLSLSLSLLSPQLHVDFGLSNIMRDGDFLKTSCGSPNYAAPEVISGQYTCLFFSFSLCVCFFLSSFSDLITLRLYAGPEVDVWSCGVILVHYILLSLSRSRSSLSLSSHIHPHTHTHTHTYRNPQYALVCARLPFDDEYIPNLFKKIREGIYTLPGHVSGPCAELISSMLVVDPLKRATISEVRSVNERTNERTFPMVVLPLTIVSTLPRQYEWFQTRLPQYLCVPIEKISDRCVDNIDESVLKEVMEKFSVERETAISALSAVQDLPLFPILRPPSPSDSLFLSLSLDSRKMRRAC